MKKSKLMTSKLAERLDEFLDLIDKPNEVAKIIEKMDIKEPDILTLCHLAEEKGYLIIRDRNDKDEEVLFNQGEIKSSIGAEPQFYTDEDGDFKYIVISNTLLGNKAQQLTILRDVYKQAKEQGIKHIIVTGNLGARNYNKNNQFFPSNFIQDKETRVEYIIKNWPKEEGITTYFVTSKFEDNNKLGMGQKITKARNDMVFLGRGIGNFKVNDKLVRIISTGLTQTYTVSYRAEQYAKSVRSEDKPDIMLIGGTAHCDKFQDRDMDVYTIPSLAGTTAEMEDGRKENTVGAFVIDMNTNVKNTRGFNTKSMLIPYYKTDKEDYLKANAKRVGRSLITSEEFKDEYSEKRAKRFYNLINNGDNVEEFLKKNKMNIDECRAWMELCKQYGYIIDFFITDDDELLFCKQLPKNIKLNRPGLTSKDIAVNQFLFISDTHIGNVHQQMHLVNQLVLEAYERGISEIYHFGDWVDGNYQIRKPYPIQDFLVTFNQQAGYLINMWPQVDGMTTTGILGNHDKTHHANGGASLDYWVPLARKDINIIGQDQAFVVKDKVKIELRHPDDGSGASKSYRSQKMIERMISGEKPNVFGAGHYHDFNFMNLRNVYAFILPCLCTQTNFELTHNLRPIVGGVFVTIYSNRKTGQIEYLDFEERLFNEKDFWDEAGKDKNKVKKLEIKNSSFV